MIKHERVKHGRAIGRGVNMNAEALRRKISFLCYAYKNPATGFLPKFFIFLALAYALSPIDLIPDFIPVLGHVDDLIIVPVLISLAVKTIPAEVAADAMRRAAEKSVNAKRFAKYSVILILFVVVLAGAAAAYIFADFR